ncbi:hypothetical protein [Sorangium cellulosum]|uniref:hypothetical protein n=1 Tax=Sorangium cellulosum TaxID=56 RepID=UPI003D9C10B6
MIATPTEPERRPMAPVSHRASSAKKTTKKTTPSRRQATKRPAGKPRPANGKASRSARLQARASSADRPNVRSTINKVLRGALELAERFGAREDGSGPATLAQLILRTLIFMLERADEPRLLAYQRAALAFSEAVRSASSEASGQVDGAGRGDGSAPPSPPGGHDDRGPARRPCEPAEEHLRAIGFKCKPTQDVWDAALADLIPHLFAGEWDPVHGILQSIERDAMLILSAVRDPDRDMTPEIDMGLYALSRRAGVVRTLYGRIVAALEKRVASDEGGHS